MFLSTFEGNIDARGRVLVPGPFRTALEGAQKFFVFPAINRGGYLEGGGEALMKDYSNILSNMPLNDPDRASFVNAIFSQGREVTMDQAGRASFPELHLKLAGIDKDMLFVGALDRFQIWSPERYADYQEAMSQHAASNQGALDAPFYQTRGIQRPGGGS